MGSWKRWLHLLHRWLGIGVGLLVLLWFGSGVVMMYVPYPALTEGERMALLQTLDGAAVRIDADGAWKVAGVAGMPETVRLAMVAGRPAWHFGAAGKLVSVWADDGTPLHVDAALALAAARPLLPRMDAPAAVDAIDIDQWTFGRLAVHRPLFRVDAGDAAGSLVYVSGRSGEPVRDTTRSERAWNWAGSVIHWLYFTPLRKEGEAWRQAVMWTSGAAFAMALAGMVLGIQRLRLKRRYAGGRRSPYRGWQAWHHWLGLVMGTLTLTWLFSGWMSVTPFGWLDSPGITAADRRAFAGGGFVDADLALDAGALLHMHPGLVELAWRRVGGRLYLGALGREGRMLLDARSGAAIAAVPADALSRAVRAVRPGAALQAEMLSAPDDVYYSHHQERAFPVLRARFALADGATFYVDPADGQLAAYADTRSRWNRWLFNAPHQLDFAAVLRARPLWDVVTATLCALGAVLATTGVVLGWRRLRRRRGARD